MTKEQMIDWLRSRHVWLQQAYPARKTTWGQYRAANLPAMLRSAYWCMREVRS